MSIAGQYRGLAKTLRSKAAREDSSDIRSEWEHLAHCYLKLAEQADRNGRTDVTDEPILRPNLDDDKGKAV